MFIVHIYLYTMIPKPVCLSAQLLNQSTHTVTC